MNREARKDFFDQAHRLSGGPDYKAWATDAYMPNSVYLMPLQSDTHKLAGLIGGCRFFEPNLVALDMKTFIEIVESSSNRHATANY